MKGKRKRKSNQGHEKRNILNDASLESNCPETKKACIDDQSTLASETPTEDSMRAPNNVIALPDNNNMNNADVNVNMNTVNEKMMMKENDKTDTEFFQNIVVKNSMMNDSVASQNKFDFHTVCVQRSCQEITVGEIADLNGETDAEMLQSNIPNSQIVNGSVIDHSSIDVHTMDIENCSRENADENCSQENADNVKQQVSVCLTGSGAFDIASIDVRNEPTVSSPCTDKVSELMDTDVSESVDIERILSASTQIAPVAKDGSQQNDLDSGGQSPIDDRMQADVDGSKPIESIDNLTVNNSKALVDIETGGEEESYTISRMHHNCDHDQITRKDCATVKDPFRNMNDKSHVLCESMKIDITCVSPQENAVKMEIVEVDNTDVEISVKETNGDVLDSANIDKVAIQIGQVDTRDTFNVYTYAERGQQTSFSADDRSQVAQEAGVEQLQIVSEQNKQCALATTESTDNEWASGRGDDLRISDADDVTDSQLCALDETMESISNSFSIPSKTGTNPAKMVEEERACTTSATDMEDGSAIMAGLIKEVSHLNKMILWTLRDIDGAKRKKTQSSKTNGK